VDLVIFAGDAFKTRSPNPTYQREFAWRIRDLAELAPVLLLVGNHDLSPSALKASSIEIYDTLNVDNVTVAHDYHTYLYQTARGPVVVGTAPYPMRARLMQNIDTHGLTIRQTDDKLEAVLANELERLAQEAVSEAPSEDTPRILTGHFTVHGAVTGSERGVMLGRDVKIPLGLIADDRWDYVALGHIHKHQCLTTDRDNAPPVVYSGSIERIDFGEESDPKGFCRALVSRGNTAWEYVEVAARPMVTLRADCKHDAQPTRTLLKLIRDHDLNEAIVRLIVELTPETEAVLNDGAVRNALKEAGVFHVAGIKRDIQRADRSRLANNPEGMTHEELLEQYLVSRDVDSERRMALLEAARPIIKPPDSD
jgi:exonuclease SbcD